MKETVLSKCEKSFILEAIAQNRRLDGRELEEFRPLNISFGSDWGCCLVTLGETKVIAQVSCEVQQPKPTRPNEGLLLLYVELSPMGAPHFEAGRQSDLAVQLNRLLEKCLKDSRCLDLESLCITAEEKVWAVRVDINVLNHEGSLVDAASVAALTALSHFRRPDVTTTGEQTIIHDPAEKDPIPITLHHHPVCVSYAVFTGDHVLADPTAIEERVLDGQIVFGANAYRELCALHLGGKAPVTADIVLQYAPQAAKRALQLVTQMKQALETDLSARNSGTEISFKECIESSSLLSLQKDHFCIQLNSRGLREGARKVIKAGAMKEEERNGEDMSDDDDDDTSDVPVVMTVGKGMAELIDKQQRVSGSDRKPRMYHPRGSDESDSSAETSSSESSSEMAHPMGKKVVGEVMSDSEVQVVAEFKSGASQEAKNKIIADIELSGDSEEEETVVLHGEELKRGPMKKQSERSKKKEKSDDESKDNSRGWYAQSSW